MIKSFDKEQFIRLLKNLSCVPGPTLNEEPRRKVLESFFRHQDLDFFTDKAGNGIVRMGEGNWNEAVVFDAHMDVVQKGFSESIRIENGKIQGLGVADNLTAVAMLSLFAVALKNEKINPKRPVYFLFTVGEEGLGNLKGINQVVLDHDTPPYVFVAFDLSFEEYSVAALGSIRYTITAECSGGHSWDDYGKPGAIEALLDFFSEIRQTFKRISTRHSDGLSFNIGTITGGEGVNSIPRHAAAEFEFRGTGMGLLSELNGHVNSLVSKMNERKGLDLTCRVTGERPAAKPVCPERIEPLAVRALKTIGEHPKPVVRSTNINATLAAGWPSLCMGLCKSGRFHSPEEYVMMDSFEKGWEILSILTENLMGLFP